MLIYNDDNFRTVVEMCHPFMPSSNDQLATRLVGNGREKMNQGHAHYFLHFPREETLSFVGMTNGIQQV
jgi:hypothetical protein